MSVGMFKKHFMKFCKSLFTQCAILLNTIKYSTRMCVVNVFSNSSEPKNSWNYSDLSIPYITKGIYLTSKLPVYAV